jgi:hypothetical protein
VAGVTLSQDDLLREAHERIGAMRVALVAAQTVIDPTLHPRTAALIKAALNYEPALPLDGANS